MNSTKNQLETLLHKALTEPGWRPEFFRVLLASEVWVPGCAIAQDAENQQSILDLQHWEKRDTSQIIPFFSSQQALAQVTDEQQPFIVMPVRALFEMTLGETLFLNARLPQGKEFTPQEIRRLLEGDADPHSEQQIIQGGIPLLLSTLVRPPDFLIEPLINLFQELKTVKRAFICQVKEQQQQKPNLLIGIEIQGDVDTIIQATGSVASDALPEDEPVDICQVIDNDPGISHFMITHILPFYQRRWGSFLRDFQNRII